MVEVVIGSRVVVSVIVRDWWIIVVFLDLELELGCWGGIV